MNTRILLSLLLCSLDLSPHALGQVQFLTGSYFPAEMEFRELRSVQEDEIIQDRERLEAVADSPLFFEVGFIKYARRVYTTSDRSDITIEIVTLKDARAAFSLLSLLRTSNLLPGPPGDFAAVENDWLLFSQAHILVRIRGARSDDLLNRVAVSISNRIGRKGRQPTLLDHFPPEGYDASSVRYFLGPKSLAAYAHKLGGTELRVPADVEVAQARYEGGGEWGVLSLIGFPTAQAADEFYESMSGSLTGIGREQVYFKRAGPILSVLAGNIRSETADRILRGMNFTYRIQWIFDRTSSGAGLLGVPFGIMGTVVQSLILTLVFCAISLAAGVAFGFFRVLLRGYAPNNIFDRSDRTGVIRLKIEDD